VIHLPVRALLLILLLVSLGCAQWPASPPEESPKVVEQRAPAPAAPAPPPVVEPKPDPPAVAEAWAAAFSKGDLEALMSLYDEDALMWGTSASQMRKGSAAIRQYYAQLLQAFPGIRVTLGEASPRVYGETGVNSGAYTLRRVSKGGRVVVTPARFTMVYVWRRGRWLIVDHHSSLGTR
jgi:uncharacterized protein (TIGR02246 family)